MDESSLDASLMKSRLIEPNVFSQQIFIEHLLYAENYKLGTGDVIVNKKKLTTHSPFSHRQSRESYKIIKS